MWTFAEGVYSIEPRNLIGVIWRETSEKFELVVTCHCEFPPEWIRPYVRGVSVARPRGKLNSGVALDWPEPSPKLSEGEP